MSGKTRILYTIAKYDPRKVTVDEEKIVDAHEHYDLLNVLSKDGANRYNNVLLSMIRFLIDNMDAKGNIKNKVTNEIADAFVGIDYGDIEDADKLYLVERVLVGDEIFYEPINVWTADVRVLKAVLIRKLIHIGMKNDDLMTIISKYGLEQYFSSIKVGGVDDSEKISFVNRFNHYLYEFYKRSNNPEEDVLEDYLEKASSPNMLASFRNQDSYAKIVFSHEFSLRGTLEQSEENIREFCENIKHYTKRMYELTYGEDFCKAKSGQGKSHYKEKFKIYDKCLSIYDRYINVVTPDRSIEEDLFGPKIDRHEETTILPERRRLDHRKDIRKHYKMALELIKQSTQGYLS